MTYTDWIREEHPTRRLELTVSASPRRRSGGRLRRRRLCRAINHNQGRDSLRHGKARQPTSSEFNSQRLRTRLVIKRAPFMSLGRLRCLTDAFIAGVIINIPQPPSSSFTGHGRILWIEFNRGLFSIQLTVSHCGMVGRPRPKEDYMWRFVLPEEEHLFVPLYVHLHSCMQSPPRDPRY